MCNSNFVKIFNKLLSCVPGTFAKYIIDFTDVASNNNYPSNKKLLRNAYRNVIKEIDKSDEILANEYIEKFKANIGQ